MMYSICLLYSQTEYVHEIYPLLLFNDYNKKEVVLSSNLLLTDDKINLLPSSVSIEMWMWRRNNGSTIDK